MDTFLQIFLLVNVFLIGIGVTIGIRHVLAHYRPHPEEKHIRSAEKAVRLSAKTREQLIEEAEATYRLTLQKTTTTLVQDLEKTAAKLSSELERVGGSIIESEMNKFEKTIEQLHTTTQSAGATAVEDIAAYEARLKETMQAEIAAEKDRLLGQIDTRLADSVTAFLIETLQHEVDLGAQAPYLTKLLDEHKAELSGRVKDEA